MTLGPNRKRLGIALASVQKVSSWLRRYKPIQSGLFRRYFLTLFILSVIPIAIVAWLWVDHAQSLIREKTLTQLEMSAEGMKGQVLEFLNYLKSRTQDFSSDGLIRETVDRLHQAPVPQDGPLTRLNRHLATHKQPIIPECVETFVLGLNGIVLASSDATAIGADHSGSEYFLAGLDTTFISDVFRRSDTGEMSWVVSTPLKKMDGTHVIGVLVNRIAPAALSDITTGRRSHSLDPSKQAPTHFSESGETYIVNRQKFMITESRFLSDVVLSQVVDTPPVHLALERGEEMTGNYPDYRGIPISGASKLLHQPNWIILTEIEFSEASIPVIGLRNKTIGFAFLLLLVLLLANWFLSHQFVAPIQRLINADQALLQGDQANASIPEGDIPRNELGKVIRSRNTMLKNLQEQEREKIRKLTSVLERMTDAVTITDKSGSIEYVNPAFERITGFKKEEALGNNSRILKSGRQDKMFYLRLWQTILAGKEFQGVLIDKKKNGDLFYDEKTITPIADSQGNITHFLSIDRDITGRRQVDEALQLTQFSIDHASDAAFWMGPDGRFFYVNEAACQSLGYSREELLSMAFYDINTQNREEDWTETWDDFRRRGSFSIESLHRTKQGKTFPVDITVNYLTFEGKEYNCVFAREITERKKLEKEVLEISDREQQRMGQDLHDNLGQKLSGIAFLSQALAQKLADISANKASEAANIVTLANEAIEETRRLARELYPVHLENNDLVSALNELASGVESLYGLTCTLISDHPIPFNNRNVAVQLYRIAQEAVNNAVKHSQAKKIMIELTLGMDGTRLVVRDDGIGLPKNVDHPESMGFRNMQNRARAMGASFHIQPNGRRGTAVMCTIPDD